jgi:hypothetical protein
MASEKPLLLSKAPSRNAAMAGPKSNEVKYFIELFLTTTLAGVVQR